MFAEKGSDLIRSIEEMRDDFVSKFFFEMKYLPLSNLRDRVEFNFAIAIFRQKKYSFSLNKIIVL